MMGLLQNLVFVLQFVLPIAVNNLVVFDSEISCEVSEATNGSCVRTVDPCVKEHVAEEQQECFGDWPTEVPSNCPLVGGSPVGNNCPNYRDSDGDVKVTKNGVVPVSISCEAYSIFPGALYGLHVSWSLSSDFAPDPNLQGFQVTLKYSDDRTPTAGCVCKNYTETEHNFTLNYGVSGQLTITVRSYPGNSDASKLEHKFNVPNNCYDLPYDPIHCGPPRYSEPSNIQVHSTLTSNGTMSAKISWGPPQFDAKYPRPSTYYLRLRRKIPNVNGGWHYDEFIASNTEVVFIHPLNITDDLYIEVQAYVKCSGYDEGNSGLHGCGVRYQVPIPPPILTSLGSATASVIWPSKSVSTSTAPTINASEMSPHGSSQWSKNKLPAVIGGAVGFVVVATVIITSLIVIHKGCRSSSVSSDDSIRSETNPLLNPEQSQNSQPVWEPPPIPPPVLVILPPMGSKMIFLLYSPKSPEEEQHVILQRIYISLRQYDNIYVTIPGDYIRGEGSPAMWLSNSMSRASVVLCVCNATFKSEWNGIRPSSIEVNTLKELVSGAVYRPSQESSLSSKYATVCLKQSDYHCIPALLSGTSRFLITETDEMVAFTTKTPTYAPK